MPRTLLSFGIRGWDLRRCGFSASFLVLEQVNALLKVKARGWSKIFLIKEELCRRKRRSVKQMCFAENWQRYCKEEIRLFESNKKKAWQKMGVSDTLKKRLQKHKESTTMVVFLWIMEIHLNLKSGWRLLMKRCKYCFI